MGTILNIHDFLWHFFQYGNMQLSGQRYFFQTGAYPTKFLKVPSYFHLLFLSPRTLVCAHVNAGGKKATKNNPPPPTPQITTPRYRFNWLFNLSCKKIVLNHASFYALLLTKHIKRSRVVVSNSALF